MERRVHIPSGEISGIVYSNGVRIEDDFEVFEGTFNNFRAAYHVVKGDRHSRDWYRFAINENKHYILKVIAKTRAHSEARGLEEEIVFSEPVDCSLLTWAQGNGLMGDDGLLSDGFWQIMKDIVLGLMYFHKRLHRNHGNISARTIFVSGGRAKLGCTRSGVRGFFMKDVEDLKAMLVTIFGYEKIPVPKELIEMCDSMKQPELHFHTYSHPILQSSEERIQYRCAAYLKTIPCGQKEAAESLWSHEYAHKNAGGLDWINEVVEKVPNLEEKFQHRFYDTRMGMEFLNFCKNVLVHPPPQLQFSKDTPANQDPNAPAKTKYTWKDLERAFNTILPDFMWCMQNIYHRFADVTFKEPPY